MDSPDTWKITTEDRTKHNATFMQLNPVNGLHLTGEQARTFFLKSNLPTPVLGQIWNLADINKDGKLDQREFSIACFLIKRVLTSPLGASVLPVALPPSLLVEPTILPLSSLTPAASTSTIQPPMIMSTTMTPSLFSASSAFPTATSSTLPPIIPSLIPTSSSTLPPTGIMSSPPAGAVFTPLAALNPASPPNPLVPIPVTSRSKYTQMFQSNDPTSTGFLNGAQAKNILLQTALPPNVLAKVWSLADYDQDGRLSLDEFVIAMHLCDYAKLGNTLPSTLPIELQPLRTRSASSVSVGSLQQAGGLMSSSMTSGIGGGSPLPPPIVPPTGQDSPPSQAKSSKPLASFEDKLRENYERGNAILEAKRQALKEQEEREKREREEKDRQEQERRQKIKEEQDRRRQQELEKQMERQRLIDQQREEEHRKMMEQKERARNELIRQQRIEWEKQKTQEMETQRLKLQELLSSLKAKDKNLEYDMQTLNDKIAAYKSKINDSQSTLNELNHRLEETRRNFVAKQMEVEHAEKELHEYNNKLNRLAQEKLYLVEQQKNLNQDSPFAEQYRNDSTQLKMKQNNMQQLKNELENIEMQINTTRTQLEIRKHELEVTRSDEADLMKENARLEQLLDLKRGNVNLSNGSLANRGSPSVTAAGYMKQSESMSSALATKNQNGSVQNIMKTSQSANSIRSNTPKDNYDALKDEIMKIHRSSVNPSPTVTTPSTGGMIQGSPTTMLNNNNTSLAFDPFASPAPFSSNQATTSNSFDPFSAPVGAVTTAAVDPFDAFSGFSNKPAGNDFEDLWAAKPSGAKIPASNSTFDNAFASAFPSTSTGTTQNNGFGADNWSAFGGSTSNETVQFDSTTINQSTPPAAFDPFSNSNFESTPTNQSADANWAAFNDEPALAAKPTSSGNIRNAVQFFDQQIKLNSPTGSTRPSIPNKPDSLKASPSANNGFNQASTPNTSMSGSSNIVKYCCMFQFDASRDDELSINVGDVINVNLSVKTDEGWIWGECRGRTGVFPIAFAAPASELGAIAEDPMAAAAHQQMITSPVSEFHTPSMKTSQSVPELSTIKNYYLSIYAYVSNEPGDLNFREFEIINVIDRTEDWLTGQVVGSGQGVDNPLRHGIFPSNFVIKFPFPIEYIGKYTISMATEAYVASDGTQLTLDPSENQLVAIKRISDDQKFLFGESIDTSGLMRRGWFPVGMATPLIDSGTAPIYVPNSLETSTNTLNDTNTADPAAPSTILLKTPPPPESTAATTTEKTSITNETEAEASTGAASITTTSTIQIDHQLKAINIGLEDDGVVFDLASSSHLSSTSSTSTLGGREIELVAHDDQVAIGGDQDEEESDARESTSSMANQSSRSADSRTSDGEIRNADNDDYIESSGGIDTPPVACPESMSTYSLTHTLNQALSDTNNSSSSCSNSHAGGSSANINDYYFNRNSSEGQSLASSSVNTPTSTTTTNNSYVNVIKQDTSTPKQQPAPQQAVETPTSPAATATSNSTPVKQEELANGYIDRVVALYEFKPDESTPGAIGFPKDAVINILDKPSDWWFGEYNGQVGILPYNYVKSIVKTEEVTKRDKTTTTSKNRSLSLCATSLLSNSNSAAGRNSSSLIPNETHTNTQQQDWSSRSSSDNIYMNCDLMLYEMGGSANHHLQQIDDNATDRSSLNEVSSDLENQLDNSLSSGGGISATLSQTDLNMVVNNKHHKLRTNIVNEIVQTERNYLKSLKLMIDLYKNPLQQMRILTKTEIDAIFANIDEIYYINSKLFSALNRRLDESRQSDQLAKIGDIFLYHLPKMSVYGAFVSANRVGEETLYEKIKASTEFNTMISKSFAAESAEFLLKKLLLLPMQRLMQYSLLIEKLIKNSTESDEDYDNLKLAQKALVDLIQSINNEVGKKDELEKLEWLEERVNLKGLTNLMGTRRLIYYGPLVKDSGKDLYAFLFNDSLLMVEASESLQSEIFKKRNSNSGGKFQLLNLYKLPIILDNITIVQSKPSHTGSDCHFHILCGEKEYSFRTTNPILKNEWIKQLQRSIEAYKQKKRSVSQSLSAYNLSQKNPVGRILIVIMEAQDLLPDSHERNVFCEASVGMQKFTTHSIDSGNPKWNTSMQFQFYDLNKDVLAVNMYDRKVYKPNTFLGKLEFKILHIYREQVKENQENNNPFTRVYRMSGVQSGKLMLKINIIVYKKT